MKDSINPQNFVAPYLNNIPRSGIRDFFEILDTRDDVISLSIGEPDFSSPQHIREAAIAALQQGQTSYTANLGLLELRQVATKYLKSEFNLNYDPKTECLITVGVSEALDLAIRAVIEPGDEVLYHQPCFVSYAPVITFAQGIPVPVATKSEDGFRLTRSELEKHVTPRTKALLINFPTNPTGAVLNKDDIKDISEFAIEHNLVLITDEVYSELTYDDERVSIAAIPEMRNRTIFMHGLSKTWAMTGFRMGIACAPQPLIEAMMKIHQYTMMCAPILSQIAAIEALSNGHDSVTSMIKEYDKRRHYICEELNKMGLECAIPKGAFYVFPSIAKCGLSSHDFAMQLLNEESVACVPGSAFGTAGEGFLRCSYATSMEEIEEAMPRMAKFVSRLL